MGERRGETADLGDTTETETAAAEAAAEAAVDEEEP